MKLTTKVVTLALIFCFSSLSYAAPDNFRQAKRLLRTDVYMDRNDDGDLYCGCNWEWKGASGGRTNLSECGYKIRAQKVRAERTEWEHVFSAWAMGHQRQCWQSGGRTNCEKNDPDFSRMEADMHNLTPVVGEVNADRSNFNQTQLGGVFTQYGECKSKTDFKARSFEPRDEAKGMVARISFYMADHYNLRLSRKQQLVFMAWNNNYPVSKWERLRDKRIAKHMGHSNPYVTGEKNWVLNQKNSGAGLLGNNRRISSSAKALYTPNKTHPTNASTELNIRGNSNSKIYHLSVGCASYEKVSPRNRVEFDSEQSAINSGYRKAGNCR